MSAYNCICVYNVYACTYIYIFALKLYRHRIHIFHKSFTKSTSVFVFHHFEFVYQSSISQLFSRGLLSLLLSTLSLELWPWRNLRHQMPFATLRKQHDLFSYYPVLNSTYSFQRFVYFPILFLIWKYHLKIMFPVPFMVLIDLYIVMEGIFSFFSKWHTNKIQIHFYQTFSTDAPMNPKWKSAWRDAELLPSSEMMCYFQIEV